MKLKKSCSNCIKGTPMPVNNDIFCRDYGVVSPDYVCSRHRTMPEPKTYKEMNYRCINCDNFIVNVHAADSETEGICQLFSVRQFDGENKGACSKFIRKRHAGVS